MTSTAPEQTILAGVAELAQLFGVRRTTISQWHSRRDQNGFPEPEADLAMGPVWDQAKVVSWYRSYTPLRNMPKVGSLPEDRVDQPDLIGAFESGQYAPEQGGLPLGTT